MVKKHTSQGTGKKQNNNNTYSAGHMKNLPNATCPNRQVNSQTTNYKSYRRPASNAHRRNGPTHAHPQTNKRQHTNRQHTQLTQNTHRRSGTTPAHTTKKQAI